MVVNNTSVAQYATKNHNNKKMEDIANIGASIIKYVAALEMESGMKDVMIMIPIF